MAARWIIALSLLCGCGGSTPAGSPPATAGLLELRLRSASAAAVLPAGDAARADGLGVLWRFGVGAPLAAPPELAADGQIYVLSREGYVHALAADGRYEWSYTLLGGVVGAAALNEAGGLYVGTVAGRVFSLRPDGSLSWVFRLPLAVLSDVVVGQNGNLYFAESECHLYAVAPNAVAVWRAELGGFVTGGPTVAPSGDIVVVTSAKELVFVGQRRAIQRVSLPAVSDVAPLLDERGNAYVVVDQKLMAFGADRTLTWTLAGVHAAALEAPHLVAFRHTGVVWLDQHGGISREVPLREPLPAALAVDSSGIAFVGSASGALVAARPDGRVRRVELGQTIRSVIADAPRQRVLVTTNSEVIALTAPAFD